MPRSTVIAPAALALLVAASPAWSASVSSTVSQKASARCNVSTSGCTNNPGPYITINGELELGGVKAKIILTNNAKFTHAASADVVIDIVLIEDGKSLTFHKQPSCGGAGGNPWIYVQFCDGKGDAFGSPILVGRCNKL